MEQVINHLGQPVTATRPEKGFYKRDTHFYHVHDKGIAHVNVSPPVINTLDQIYLAQHEELQPIGREIFEAELRSTIFDIGIYEYVKSI